MIGMLIVGYILGWFTALLVVGFLIGAHGSGTEEERKQDLEEMKRIDRRV